MELLNDASMSSGQLLEYATLFWSAKETLFKWYGSGQVDFRKHLQLRRMNGTEEEGTIECCFQKDTNLPINVSYRFLHGLALSWVNT
jgi:hypothetical protein